MSSFATGTDEEGALQTCVLRTHSLPQPAPLGTLTSWKASLLGPDLPAEAQALVERLEESRVRMMHELSSSSAAASASAAAAADTSSTTTPGLDAHLSALQQLLESLNCQATVKVYRQLQFCWTGALCVGIPVTARRHEPCGEIIYEIVMVVWAKVMAAYRRGVALLTTATANSASENDLITAACKAFATAAAVAQYLSEDVLPRWLNAGRRAVENMPEASAGVARAFRSLCLASACQCVVAQALRAAAPSSRVLSKLCAAVAMNATEALDSVHKAPQESRLALDPSLLTHMAFLKAVFSALAFFHAGEAAQKGAVAVANYGAATTLLRQQGSAASAAAAGGRHDPFSAGLPQLTGNSSYSSCYPALAALLGAVKDKHETADIENARIYYEAPLREVALPEPVSLVKAPKYAPPPAGSVVYFAVAKKAAPKKAEAQAEAVEAEVPAAAPAPAAAVTTTAPAPVAAAEAEAAVEESDETFARRLQEEWNVSAPHA